MFFKDYFLCYYYYIVILALVLVPTTEAQTYVAVADWDTRGGASVIDTSDDSLYLRSSYPAKNEVYSAGDQEICDGKDNDCDGIIPANEADKDEDGFMICYGDCDDSDDTVATRLARRLDWCI